MSKISIVTPTYERSEFISDYLDSLNSQTVLPFSIILVDASQDEKTKNIIKNTTTTIPVIYERAIARGTGPQRNQGLELALKQGSEFILFMDDDVRLKPSFIEEMINVFKSDTSNDIAIATGYRTNGAFNIMEKQRYVWYKKLGLLKRIQSGNYDNYVGIPINIDGDSSFNGIRNVEFCSTACTIYRAEVLAKGFRFHEFFTDYGMLEDAHLSHRVFLSGKKIVQLRQAECIDLRANSTLKSPRLKARKTVRNFYFVFNDLYGPLSFGQLIRFFKFQYFELFRQVITVFRYRNMQEWSYLLGKIEGIVYVHLLRFGKKKI